MCVCVFSRTRREHDYCTKRGFAENVQKLQFLRLHAANRRIRYPNGKLQTVSTSPELIRAPSSPSRDL